MSEFFTKRLAATPDAVAPDGSAVRILARLAGGSMAHFELAAAQTSRAVAHSTVEEIWYFLAGRGEMWRQLDRHEERQRHSLARREETRSERASRRTGMARNHPDNRTGRNFT